MSSKKKHKNQKHTSAKAQPAAKAPVKRARQYSLKKKLPVMLLLSLALPLMLCITTPFEIFAGNLSEFTFSLMDFLPLCILFMLALSALNFAVLSLLDGLAYELGCGVLVWLSLMSFLQRNFLNRGINALVGDGVGTATVGIGDAIVNLLIWLAVGGAIICCILFLRKKQIENIMLVAAIAAVALIGSQLVSFTVVSLTTDVYTPVTERNSISGGDQVKVLTYNKVNQLSKKNNIVFFLVDRFDAKYYDAMLREDPTFFDDLDGFTHFSDYTSLYCRTYPAVASILTGKDHDFTRTKATAFADFFSDGGGNLATLTEAGYDIGLYTEKGYVYSDASVMADYVDNTSGVLDYYIDSYLGLSFDMWRLSLSEFLPIAAKGWAGYMSTPDFNAHAKYDSGVEEESESESETDENGDIIFPDREVDAGDEYVVDESGTGLLYEYLLKNEPETVKSEGRFTFIHLYGCHDTTQSAAENVQTTFELIYYYLEEMKALGLYEDATIIITGDHAAALSDSKMIGAANKNDDGTRVTAMLFKPSGESGTPLKHSAAQISQDELWNTIWSSEGIAVNHGPTFFDIPEGEDRERRYIFEMYKNPKNNDLEYNRLYEYKITGTALDGENWQIVKETDIIK